METEGARREESVRSLEGRAWLRASHPSCELRGINGPQLARLRAVFLAFPEEGEQSAQAVVPAPRSGCDPAPGCQVPSWHQTREIRLGKGRPTLLDLVSGTRQRSGGLLPSEK